MNDALATNESGVRKLADETLKRIAHELTENLRKNLTVDWSKRESVRAILRLMVKRILRKHKCPPVKRRFNRPFSSSSVFKRLASDTSIPLNLASTYKKRSYQVHAYDSAYHP